MKEFIIKQLRERATMKGKQKTWISDLSDDELYQVFQKLRNGESSRSVAKYIQQRWRLQASSDVHSVSQGVLKFKRKMQDLLEMDIPVPQDKEAKKQDDLIAELESRDDLLRLDRIIRLQGERIERMLVGEREHGVKHTNLSRDIQSLTALVKQFTAEKQFALEHQGEDPVKQRQEEIRNRRMDERFNTLLPISPTMERG
jgi:hypothetical protein